MPRETPDSEAKVDDDIPLTEREFSARGCRSTGPDKLHVDDFAVSVTPELQHPRKAE
jgi:hypothetical protein